MVIAFFATPVALSAANLAFVPLRREVLLNYGVLDICWIWGGYRVDIDQINYIIIRPLSMVYPSRVYTFEMSKVYQLIIYAYP